MFRESGVSKSKQVSVLLVFAVALFALPSFSPLSQAASPSPSPTSTSRSRVSPTPTPSATAQSNVPQLNAVYSDTFVPQIKSIDSATTYVEDLFTLSFLITARIHRNTIQNISIEVKPKTTPGVAVDPIFQAPCAKLEKASVTAVTTEGNSAALQKRTRDGDWHLEEYVVESKTKLTKGQRPCLGTYVITDISLTDAAKHTFNVAANLGSTTVIQAASTNSSGSNKQPTTQTKIINSDTAIMQSNIWNSRPDLAPCTAGTNLLPTTSSVVINGKTTQAVTSAPILSTNRVACAPTIGFNIASPIITIKEDATVNSLNSVDTLPIFDVGSELRKSNEEIAKLKTDLAKITDQNTALLAEITKLKTPVVVKATPKPKAKATTKPKAKTTKRPSSAKSPTPARTRSSTNNNSQWNSTRSPTPTARK